MTFSLILTKNGVLGQIIYAFVEWACSVSARKHCLLFINCNHFNSSLNFLFSIDFLKIYFSYKRGIDFLREKCIENIEFQVILLSSLNEKMSQISSKWIPIEYLSYSRVKWIPIITYFMSKCFRDLNRRPKIVSKEMISQKKNNIIEWNQ